MLDEVRVESVPRSADWIRAAYMTQAENESFTSYNRWGSLMLMRSRTLNTFLRTPRGGVPAFCIA